MLYEQIVCIERYYFLNWIWCLLALSLSYCVLTLHSHSLCILWCRLSWLIVQVPHINFLQCQYLREHTNTTLQVMKLHDLICYTYKQLIRTHYRLSIVHIRKGVCLNSSWVSIQIWNISKPMFFNHNLKHKAISYMLSPTNWSLGCHCVTLTF